MNNFDFSEETLEYLYKANWNDKRKNGLEFIELPKDFNYPESVLDILRSLGGLKIGEDKPGINIIQNLINFNPISAETENEEDGIFRYYSDLLKINLYSLGNISDLGLYLAIDDENRLYTFNDWFFKNGNNLEQGLHNLLVGIKGERLNEEILKWEEF